MSSLIRLTLQFRQTIYHLGFELAPDLIPIATLPKVVG
jgi:hypothetical protein